MARKTPKNRLVMKNISHLRYPTGETGFQVRFHETNDRDEFSAYFSANTYGPRKAKQMALRVREEFDYWGPYMAGQMAQELRETV